MRVPASSARRQFRSDLVYLFTIMIDDGISAGDGTEGERGSEGECGEEEHLKCSHPKASRPDEPRNWALCTPAFATNTQRFPIVTDKFQNDMIAPFIESGAWL